MQQKDPKMNPILNTKFTALSELKISNNYDKTNASSETVLQILNVANVLPAQTRFIKTQAHPWKHKQRSQNLKQIRNQNEVVSEWNKNSIQQIGMMWKNEVIQYCNNKERQNNPVLKSFPFQNTEIMEIE